MSLVCWLPLNGDLRNQGCADIIVNNTGATVDNNGKIGKCYSFSSKAIYGDIPNFNNYTQISGCCWIYLTNLNSAQYFIHCGGQSSYPCKFSIDYEGSIRFQINGTEYTSGITLTTNTWYHIAVAWNGTEAKLYVNGVERSTKNASGTFNASNHFAIGARTNSTAGNAFAYYITSAGKINDVRIYDHCLSAAEVREISQGLVLHYKLDQNITVGENIMPNSLNMGLGSANPSTGTWRTAGSNSMTRSRVAINDTPEGSGYGFQNSGIQTPNDGSCYGIDSFPMEANTDYIISMWARITSGTEGYAGFNVYSCTVTGGSWTQQMKNYYVTPLPANGAWTKCWMSYKTNTATTRNIYIGITTGDTDVTTQMCNIHIEKGTINNNNIIEDSSGYNHNGILTNTAFITSNTPRYSNAIYLSKVKINCTDGFPTGENPNFTISFWTKILSTITYVSYGDLIGMYDTGQGSNTFRLELCGSPASNNLMWFRGPSGQSGGGFNMNSSSSSGWFSKDTWHHIVLAGDGINKKYYCYLDGNLCQTYNGSANSWQPTGQWYLGDTTEATAYFSDLRIYCTALDADAIRQLYEVGAKVDNTGNLHTFELLESNNGRELLAVPLTTSYGNHINIYTNYDVNGEITLTGGSSIGSYYIPINPSGKTYYYDIEISTDSGNVFYIGFQRYDANKTARSNDATVYLPGLSGSNEARTHKHYHGTVDLSTDGVNPCAFTSLRILNDWSGANNRHATIHKISLREVSTLQNTKINKQGKVITTELIEMNDKFRVHKNGIIETNEIIEL